MQTTMKGRRGKQRTILVGHILPILALIGALAPGAPPPLVINEFVASNGSGLADEDGDHEDWLEILNLGEEPVGLHGFGLSDDDERPGRWVFPDVTIGPGAFLVVWASGKDRAEPNSPLHTNFSIAAAGEPLLLTDPTGEIVDLVDPVALPRDVSHGRKPDGSNDWRYFTEPTPGASNTTTGYTERMPPPIFSHRAGFHTSPFQLEIRAADPEARIIYTLDGSEPLEENLGGRAYLHKQSYPQEGDDPPTPFHQGTLRTRVLDGPLEIGSRADAPNHLSLISTTFHPKDIYVPQSPVFKGTTVRARVVKEGALPGDVVTRTYFVDPRGRERYHLPVIAITTSEDNLFEYETGIYTAGAVYDVWRSENPESELSGGSPANYHQRGREWERPAHFELFEAGSNEGVSQAMGLRIHGGWSRHFPQKSLRLYARPGYSGEDTLDYPLLPGLKGLETGGPVESFTRFILRSGGNDYHMTRIRDPFLQEVIRPLGLDQQGYRPAVHFINGEYWGLIAIRERIDRYFIASHHGIDPGEVVILNSYGSDGMYTLEEGPPHVRQEWLGLQEYIEQNDMADPLRFAFVEERLDVGNFIDYQAAQIYIKNTDWPANNTRFWRKATPEEPPAPRTHDGRWRWIVFDLDMGFITHAGWDVTHDTLAHATAEGSDFYANPDWSTAVLRNLLDNPGFRTAFINSMAGQMNTIFRPERIDSIVDRVYGEIEGQIPEHGERWLDFWNRSPEAYKVFGRERPDIVRQHVVEHFGLSGTYGITVELPADSSGSLRIGPVTLDDDTPGMTGGFPYHRWTGTWFGGVPVEVEALPAPGHQFAGWEGSITGPEASKTITLERDVLLRPRFEEKPQPSLLHYWSFNDPVDWATPCYTIGGGLMDYSPGPETGFTTGTGYGFVGENARLANPPGRHLRVNNPLEATITLALPTVGYEDPVLRWETCRSGQGGGLQLLEYSTDGEEFHLLESLAVPEGEVVVHGVELGDIEGASDNPALHVRITFGKNGGGEAGNNRLDNITLEALPLSTTAPPPVLTDSPGLIEMTAGSSPFPLPLDSLFDDPADIGLAFEATSSHPETLEAGLEEAILLLNPIAAGDAVVTIKATNHETPPVPTSFRILVYPEPHALASSPFRFTQWHETEPEGAFPPAMIFLQSGITDPGAGTPLLHPYHIPPEEWHEDDLPRFGFPYAASRRTRITALGSDGISFINTGRGRDLGGALLALNTDGVQEANLRWSAGTVLRNERLYGIRLQYRIGTEGPFEDLLLHGFRMEYVAADDGDFRGFDPVPLPAELLGKENVQLLWRYHHIEGTSGPRAELRLDDISVMSPVDGDLWLLH